MSQRKTKKTTLKKT